jgi:iron complex outermembrane recepter protein
MVFCSARIRHVLGVLLPALMAVALMGTARAAGPKITFQLPADDAAEALTAFARQSQLQLLFDYGAVQGIRTHAVEGSFEADHALSMMLNGTGLDFELINERTITIVALAQVMREPDTRRQARAAETPETSPAPPAPNKPARSGSAASGNEGPIEEVVVTAEKVERALQRTALAVTALAPRTMERQQVTDLKSVTVLIPNLQVGLSSTQAAFDIALRGIVSNNRTEVGDAAVAFHVDGFYSPRPQGSTMLIYDIERLEALRGPQGTLFGRNANAGVINIVTAKPDFNDVSASLDLTRGSYDLTRLKGHLNVPVSDSFALRGAGYLEKREGYIDFLPGSNATPGTPRYDDSDKVGLRLSASWEPGERWRVFATAERYADRGAGTIPLRLNPERGDKLRSALISSPGRLDMQNDTVHVRTDLALKSGLELSYLFGWARMTRRNVSDQDVGLAQDPELRALPNPPLHATFNEERRTVDSEFMSSQHELQLKSSGNGRLDWIVGGFFYDENNSIRFDVDSMDDRGTVPGVADAGDMRFSQSFIQPNRSLSAWAGFGQATWHFSQSSRATAGARFTRDTKQDEDGINIVCPGPNATIGSGGFNLIGIDTPDIPFSPDPDSPNAVPGTCRIFAHNDVKKDWEKLTWMGRLEHDLADDLLGYAMVSTGFKSGVIQDGGSYADPEEVVNYELGLKATLLEGTMLFNTVGFFSDYSDLLRTRVEYAASGTHQQVTRNATRASIFGIESELLWKPSVADTVQAVFTYLNAEYRNFPTVDFQYYVPNDPLTPVINLEGNKLPFAPEYTAALVYEHSFNLANGGRLVPRLQTKYQSEMFLTDFNRASDRQEAYTRTDLSFRYEAAKAWLLEVYVQNVEDEAVKNNVDLRANQPGTGGVPGFPGVARAFFDAPRTYGLRAAFRFDE